MISFFRFCRSSLVIISTFIVLQGYRETSRHSVCRLLAKMNEGGLIPMTKLSSWSSLSWLRAGQHDCEELQILRYLDCLARLLFLNGEVIAGRFDGDRLSVMGEIFT
jgi:hypothetical protein